MNRRRVLLLALHFAEYSMRLAQALSAHADVRVVLYADNAEAELGPDWTRQWIESGVSAITLQRPRGLAGILRNVQRLEQCLREFQPEILHVQEAWRDETVWAWPWWRRVPMVLTVHDPTPHAGEDTRRMKYSRRGWYRRFLRGHAACAITHGTVLAETLAVDSPTLRGRIHLAVHGPLGGPRTPMPPSAGTQRLLFFGRIEAYKGLRHFVDAVLMLRSEGVPVQGVIAGRGEDLTDQRLRIGDPSAFDLRDRFVPVDEVVQLFRDCSAVVLPYIEGTQSGVAAMALGFGRPVIATHVGAIPEMVRDGQNGLLVAPADSGALTGALRRFIAEPRLREVLAAGASRLARGDLSWDSAARSTIDAYELALGTRLLPRRIFSPR